MPLTRQPPEPVGPTLDLSKITVDKQTPLLYPPVHSLFNPVPAYSITLLVLSLALLILFRSFNHASSSHSTLSD